MSNWSVRDASLSSRPVTAPVLSAVAYEAPDTTLDTLGTTFTLLLLLLLLLLALDTLTCFALGDGTPNVAIEAVNDC